MELFGDEPKVQGMCEPQKYVEHSLFWVMFCKFCLCWIVGHSFTHLNDPGKPVGLSVGVLGLGLARAFLITCRPRLAFLIGSYYMKLRTPTKG